MIHRIRKQLMDLTFDSSLDGFHLQHEISQQYWNEVVPIMDSVFEKIDVENSIIEIDRLEIDLGTIMVSSINQHTWLRDLPLLIEKSIGELLIEHKLTHKVHISHKLKLIQQWLFYMQHGYLSWNAEPFTEQLYSEILKILESNPEYAEDIQKIIAANVKTARRIANHHTPSFLLKLLNVLTLTSQNILIQVIDELFMVYQHIRKTLNIIYPLSQKAFANNCFTELLQVVVNKSIYSPEKLRAHLVNVFFFTYDYAKKLPIEITGNLVTTKNIFLEKQEQLAYISKKFEDNIQELKTERLDPDIIDEEGIFIVNAGLVLLHPFFSTFFNRLNLLCDNEFVDEVAQVNAMMLCHYLATGEESMQEFDLIIAKILCSYPLEEPINLESILTEEQKGEADAMLSAAIQQWSIIQHTGIGALREGFLQRPGKFYTMNDKLYLHVETGGIDLLLDQLPWNLSLIKLPWMERMLNVIWR